MKRLLFIAVALATADAHAAPLDDAITCATYATMDYICREQRDPSDPLLGKAKFAVSILHGRSIRVGAQAGVSKEAVGALASIATDKMTKEMSRSCDNIKVLRDQYEGTCRPVMDQAYKDTLITIDEINEASKKRKGR
ncbi:hypothetical protein JQ596_15670 [Bradyrhizobium manausense]|uniref:hypothetical protein n=1 Tax=Bradyrhizobium manausense TaxID=989370 RepID=UPI001BA86EED|nr:hypothetical protein [Bradyrhizobium manausense]MBR0826983.1 hypothetical protein [Bradyrhizobium manausense]